MTPRTLAPLFAVLFTLLILEVGSWAIYRFGLLALEPPSYSLRQIEGFWYNDNPVFGVWHHPNDRYRHRMQCIDVEYTSNSWGARDRERTLESARPRVLMLGDSFVEGYGVARDERLSDRLEDASGIEHLNMGAAGHFGPTQYSLLYRDFALRFDHDWVLVGLLPRNDFRDDDLEHGKLAHRKRYRPYLVGEYPDYELVYYRDSMDVRWTKQVVRYADGFMEEFSWFYSAIDRVSRIRKHRAAEKGGKHSKGKRAGKGYTEFSEAEFDKMRYSLEQIVEAAGEREVLIFTIPSNSDFERYETDPELKLPRLLAALAEEIGAHYIDLLPGMAAAEKDSTVYLLECDDHWNAYGHEKAAEILLEHPVYRSMIESAGH